MDELSHDVRDANPLVPLSNETLDLLPAGIQRPRYDRASLRPGIVHIGLGNFHRAHQAWYLHRLMQQGAALDWAIVGAGVRPYDAAMRVKLLAQDCLTTLIGLDPSGTSAEVCGSMIDYVPIEEGNAPLIAAMTLPGVRIVTLTVTEGGYYTDTTTGALDIDHPDIAHDATNPGRPRTVFGAIVKALRTRRDSGAGPLTVQSCDNLLGNGLIARQAVVSLARLSDADLADWIDAACSFPNSMVDCIVPSTGEKELALVRSLGIEDNAPVTHESFRQWVIEDEFCAGRPPWEKVGVTFTKKVYDYETMKLRILNAGHQVLANVGEVLGIATISECMLDPDIAAYFRKVQQREIAPHVSSVPGQTPEEYITLIEQRFSNLAIVDTTRRVAFDGSSRHSAFVVPIVKDALARGTPVDGLALVEALWARMCFGTREDGSRLQPNDPNWDALMSAAQAARSRPVAWLEQHSIYGDLIDQAEFQKCFEKWLEQIWSKGARSALRAYVSS